MTRVLTFLALAAVGHKRLDENAPQGLAHTALPDHVLAVAGVAGSEVGLRQVRGVHVHGHTHRLCDEPRRNVD